MLFTIKRWGNGIAVRLPRESPELGRLEEGMRVEAHFRPVKPSKNWKPYTFRSGIRELSVRHDEILEAAFQERWGHLNRVKPSR